MLQIILVVSFVVLLFILVLCCRLRFNKEERLLAELQARQNAKNIFDIKKKDLIPINWVKMSAEET